MTPTRARRSLGFTIKQVVFGLIGATAVVFAGGVEALRRIDDHYAQVADRLERFHHDAGAMMTAMLNQEVGMRAYLATGDRPFLDPLLLGERQEQALLASLRSGGEAITDPALPVAVERVSTLIARWHHEVADPQLRDRRAGALEDLPGKLQIGKQVFDAFRVEHGRMMAAIEVRASDAREARDALVSRVVAAMLGLAALVWGLAAIVTLRVVGGIVRPLVELVRRAERSEGFVAPAESEAIHEVHALGTALHQLDAQIERREAELARAHDDALALTRFGEFVQQLSHEDEMHKALERVCRSLVAPSEVSILVRNASKNRLAIARSTAPAPSRRRLPILDDPMKCRAVRTMREVRENSDSPTACDCVLGVPVQGSMLCLPLLAAGELIGVVNLQSARPDYFDDLRMRTLHSYLGFAGGAVGALHLLAATRELALRDPLTGAHNRAFLSEYLPKTIAVAKRHRAQVAVLMADLDHFKRINDEHGHPVGDQAIVAFARCALQQIRASDVLVRYGGEEFAIVLSDVTTDSARSTAERIRIAVEGLRLIANAIDHGQIVQVSIGVALFPDHGDDPQGLIAVADAALYAAKQRGRNQVVVADVVPGRASDVGDRVNGSGAIAVRGSSDDMGEVPSLPRPRRRVLD